MRTVASPFLAEEMGVTQRNDEPSNFYKIVGRETAEVRDHGETHASRHHALRSRSTRLAAPYAGFLP